MTEPEVGTPCPACGSLKWMAEMGGAVHLRHYRGCPEWTEYFDGGEKYATIRQNMPDDATALAPTSPEVSKA